MFTDIVGSTTLNEAMGDVAWERLIRWHDDTLRGLITKGGGDIVKSMGDGVFAAFESPRAAVQTAIAIQRALREHRGGSGFALSVRIGLHAAEATVRANDYSGMAVNIASRIGALAGGGEILASAETLHDAGPVVSSASRDTPIRGAAAPISVTTIDWS